jgi:PilZ domain
MTLSTERASLRISPGAPATEATALVMSAAKAKYLLETIVSGAYESAIQAAALSLLLGVCVRTQDASRMLSFRHILIDDSEVMLFALTYGDEVGLGGEAVEALRKLYRGIAGAKRDLVGVLSPRNGRKFDREIAQGAAQSWRKIVELARAAIEHLQRAVKGRLHETYERDGRTVADFLRQAGAGDANAFDDKGALRLPRLEQRRRLPRLAVQQSCQIVMSSGAHRAKLADVSTQGLAVISEIAPFVGETVGIVLADGRRLGATVVRMQGAKIGLRLAKALASSDPLFAAGRS